MTLAAVKNLSFTYQKLHLNEIKILNLIKMSISQKDDETHFFMFAFIFGNSFFESKENNIIYFQIKDYGMRTSLERRERTKYCV